jgi:hypothetical protein
MWNVQAYSIHGRFQHLTHKKKIHYDLHVNKETVAFMESFSM